MFHGTDPFVFASYLFRLRVSQAQADPNYVAWVINSPIGRQQVNAISRQIMQNNINSEEICSLEIPLPPLNVERKIMAEVQAGLNEIAELRARANEQADAAGLAVKINDGENGALNPQAINALRNFPVFGNVVWGARTLDGADQKGSEWKYIPVRRLTLYLEESLLQGLEWVVFEPNGEPLWQQIRMNVGAFMYALFRQGAFQGSKPEGGYLVKCGRETNTDDDVNRGVVNIIVGFAPLKPAEFVVIKIQRKTPV